MAVKLRLLSMKNDMTARERMVVIPITTIISLRTNPFREWRSINIILESITRHKGCVGPAPRHLPGHPVYRKRHLPHFVAVAARERHVGDQAIHRVANPKV